MKTGVIFVLAIFSFFLNVAPAVSEEPQCFFEMTDGYFQKANSQPRHLLDGTKDLNLKLGDDFTVWIHFRVTGKSPCDPRAEKGCEVLFELVDSSGTVRQLFETIWTDARFNDGDHFSYSFPGRISRKAAFGDANVRVRIF